MIDTIAIIWIYLLSTMMVEVVFHHLTFHICCVFEIHQLHPRPLRSGPLCG